MKDDYSRSISSRYLIGKPDAHKTWQYMHAIGGKASQLTRISPKLVPTWVAITSDCPDRRLPDVCDKAWKIILTQALEDEAHPMGEPPIEHTLFAVRSSAMEEDGDNQSFAGIFESKLNVYVSGIEHAVREVRDSALAERVLTYQEARDLSTLSVPAVIIMPMVDAKYSGVLFTKEPVDGTDRMLLEYEQGIGGVVDGTGDSMTFFLDRNNFYETSMLKATLPPYDEELTHSHPPAAIHTIWEEAKRLENNYRKPLDIEWAVDQDDKPWILQVRPITAGV